MQGDGINHQTIRSILYTITLAGYSADNVAFGQGGALLQMVNRDDQKFAMKCSAAFVNGEWVDVFKDPITDKGKRSNKGKLKLVKDIDQYITVDSHDKMFYVLYDELEVVFENGVLIRDMTFDEIRANASK